MMLPTSSSVLGGIEYWMAGCEACRTRTAAGDNDGYDRLGGSLETRTAPDFTVITEEPADAG